MDLEKNHWIALYLSGQYPGKYIIPNKLDILFTIRRRDTSNFGDPIIGLLHGKSDAEYFKSLLDTFEKFHGEEKCTELLEDLNIPEEVRGNPNNKVEQEPVISIENIEKRLEGLDEEHFSRQIITPLLEKMGYENIEFKGKVNETDFGLDFYPVSFTSPGGTTHYAGVQTKAKKMTAGDTTGSELNKLINETGTAFGQKHRLNTGEEIRISEYIVFNSKDVVQQAREKYFKDENVEKKKVKLYAKESIISLIQKYGIK